ncbi:MAG: phosphatase PAP2 family protein [Anaerolineales bacterium]|nr:phosphatase PAP2 family protein [Anaerolineales bacterium]
MSWKQLLERDRDWSYGLRVAEKPGTRRTLAMLFAHSGDSWFWGLGLLLLWLSGNSFWKQWALYQLFWISSLAVLVIVLKFSIRRRRPEGEWGAIYRNTDPHSFPSGHAARAFLIAALASWLGPFPLALALWIWAPLVSLARVAMGVHYVSDVLAGALVGLIVAALAWPVSPALFSSLNAWLVSILGLPLW